ncbi:lysosomal acid phosphatase-like isoform X2 [Ischnura elegans]|nr:lysosomal acid phosphatase-like isoform X2 [Ischnura elegans]
MMAYPTSPYSNETDWKEGFEQLTVRGMKSHFEFGKWIMDHYGPNGLKFLPPEYNQRDYRVYSTDTDRTIQSALANSAGIYVPRTSRGIDESIRWNAIPVRSIMVNEYDTVFGQFCPALTEILDKLRKERFGNMKAKYPDLFQYAQQKSGMKILENPFLTVFLSDTLRVEKSVKGKIPGWAEPIFPSPMDVFFKELLNEYTDNEKITRLTAGPTLKTIINAMVNNTRGEDEVKLYSFSAHDMNVHSIRRALRVPLSELADYTSAVIFELYKGEMNDHYVKVLYRSGPGDTEPLGLVIPGCGGSQFCTLDRFIEVTQNLLPGNLEKECEASTEEFKELSKDEPTFKKKYKYPYNVKRDYYRRKRN